jgi:Do/DeqQ family serine protease
MYMKTIWKKASSYLGVVLLSISATYATYHILDSRRGISGADEYNYGNDFNQKGVHLASMTAGGYPDFTKAAESSVHAVVHIKSVVKAQQVQQSRRGQMIDPFEYFFGFGDSDRGNQFSTPQPQVGYGSGVIISEDGYIITNNHVINQANDIEVTLNDNRKLKAKLIGADPTTDIALLKIDGKGFSYIPFGNSDNLKVGEWVLAVGNPFNLTSTVTAGIVSAKGRGGIGRNEDRSIQSIQSFIQTDAAINPGNSGGALVNTDGQLVGINTAIYSQTGNFAGYGFAVPISIAGKVASDLKEYGTVQRAVLGVQIIDVSTAKDNANDDNSNLAKTYAKAKNLKINEGAYVGGFADRSPAKESGIEEGDVITGVNNVAIRSVSELQDQINRFRPGDKVKVTFNRLGATKTVTVELKNSDGNAAIVKKVDGIESVGAAFKDLSDEKLKNLGISRGVEVSGVDNNGTFQKSGITKGFIIMKINNQPVSSASEVEEIIQSVARSQDKALFIAGFYPANKRMRYYAIDLGE